MAVLTLVFALIRLGIQRLLNRTLAGVPAVFQGVLCCSRVCLEHLKALPRVVGGRGVLRF